MTRIKIAIMKQHLCLVFAGLFFSALKINAANSDVAVSLRVPADHVLMTLTIESSEKTLEKREASIEADRKMILDRARSVVDLTVVEVPEVSQHRPYFKTSKISSSKISSFSLAGVPEIPQSGFSRMNFEVRADLRNGVLVTDAVRRVRAFVHALRLSTKTRRSLVDVFSVRVSNPESFRAALLKRISEDVLFLRRQLDQNAEVTLSGLEQPVRQRRVGPLEVELFIPYSLTLRLKADRESKLP